MFQLIEITGKLVRESQTVLKDKQKRRQRKSPEPERYLLIGLCRVLPSHGVLELRGHVNGFNITLDLNFKLVGIQSR